VSDVSLWLRASWDRLLGLVLIGAGGAFLALTYHGVAGSRFVADQMSYLASGGVGGLFLLGLGASMRIQADLQDEWRKLDRIESALRESDGVDVSDAATGARPERRRATPVAAAAGLAGSAAIAAVGFQRCANAGTVDGAMEGLVIASLGLALALVTTTGSTLGLRRRVAGRTRRIVGPFLRGPSGDGDDASDVVFVAPGLARFHRAGCAMLNRTGGHPTARADLGGRSPCGICGASEMTQ
jgi:hypothetical protein